MKGVPLVNSQVSHEHQYVTPTKGIGKGWHGLAFSTYLGGG